MRKILLILILFWTVLAVQATHNRAGEITYVHRADLTYDIYVTTYTKTSSLAADRCELIVDIVNCSGGTWKVTDTIPRFNGSPCPDGSCFRCGEELPNDIKKNIYWFEYTFAGPGCYTISINDPNRNDGIENIDNSVNTTFYIESDLLINPFAGYNSSPILTNPPIDNGCVNQIYQHGLQAIDPDGTDSLAYELVSCLAPDGTNLAGYVFPNEVTGCTTNPLTIDQVSGVVTWNSPVCTGEFNICILISEYRNGVFIGSILRDMQLTIYDCDNSPPVIDPIGPLCITAGDTVSEVIGVTDSDVNEFLDFTATGVPFTYTNPPTFWEIRPSPLDDTIPSIYYQFNDNTGDNIFYYEISGGAPLTGYYYWESTCDNIQLYPHRTYLKATDQNAQFSLPAFHTLEITVIAPAPLNPTATPSGNSMILNWSHSNCIDITNYRIYRKLDSLGWTPGNCETGVPGYTGYGLIATLSGTTITYTDDSNGAGLIHGQQYCYMVVAVYDDGAQSYASVEFCGELKKDVPVITRVSVNYTDVVNGSDTVEWSMPTELDTSGFLGVYSYEIYRRDSATASFTLVQTLTHSSLALLDTVFVDTLIDTKTFKHYYKINLLINTSLLGSTHEASSIYLHSIPSDNKVELNWYEEVPWTNNKYVVYKQNGAGTFVAIDTTTANTYTEYNLVNGNEYCYYVKSFGSYSSGGFIDPIINLSQEKCETPYDNEAPCPPQILNNAGSCDLTSNTLYWNNPNNVCANDVVGYYVYHAKLVKDELIKVLTFNSALDTFFVNDNSDESIAGCYAVSAIDSAGNESVKSDTYCIDNCPEYTLPNVFTPGSDGLNDLFIPYPYKFVERIELTIFNRWGGIVFTSTDPDILWNGKSRQSNTACPDGVYYYRCDVYEIRINGIEMRTIQGYVSLLRGQ